MTAGFNFNNYAAGFCSATPALRGNEVSMDTIDLGNSESLVCGVFPNQDGTFTAMTSVSLNRRFPARQNLTADKRSSTARNQYAETRTRHHRARLYQ